MIEKTFDEASFKVSVESKGSVEASTRQLKRRNSSKALGTDSKALSPGCRCLRFREGSLLKVETFTVNGSQFPSPKKVTNSPEALSTMERVARMKLAPSPW